MASSSTRLTVRNERRKRRLEQVWILGSIDEPHEVSAIAVDETGLFRSDHGDVSDCHCGDAAVLEDYVARAAADPDEKIMLGCRCALPVEADDLTERAEASRHFIWREASPEVGTECNYEVHTASRNGRLLQLPDQATGVDVVDTRTKVKLDEFVRDGAMSEYPELR